MSKFLLPLDSYKKYYLQFSPIWKYYQQNDTPIPFKYCRINTKFMVLYCLRQIKKGRLSQSPIINYLSNLQKLDYHTHRLCSYLNFEAQQNKQITYLQKQSTQQLAKLKLRYLKYLRKVQLVYKQEQFQLQLYNYYVFFKSFQQMNWKENLDQFDYAIIYQIKHNIYTLLLLSQIKSFIWPYQGRQNIMNYLFSKIQQGWTDIDTLRTIARSFIIKVPYYINLIKLINELLNIQQHTIRRIKFTRETVPQLTNKQYKIFFKQIICYLRYLVTYLKVQKYLYTTPNALDTYLKILQRIEITKDSCHLDLCEYVAVYSLNLQLLSTLENYIYLKYEQEFQIQSFRDGLKTIVEINKMLFEKSKKLGLDKKILTEKDVQYLINCKIKIAKKFREQIYIQLIVKQLIDMNLLQNQDIKIKILELAIMAEAQIFIKLVVKETKFSTEQYLKLCKRHPYFLHFIIHRLKKENQVRLPYNIECYVLYKYIYEKHTNYKFVIKDIYQLRHLLLHSNYKEIPIKEYKLINMTAKQKYFLQFRRQIFKMANRYVGYYPFALYYWGAYFTNQYNQQFDIKQNEQEQFFDLDDLVYHDNVDENDKQQQVLTFADFDENDNEKKIY